MYLYIHTHTHTHIYIYIYIYIYIHIHIYICIHNYLLKNKVAVLLDSFASPGERAHRHKLIG